MLNFCTRTTNIGYTIISIYFCKCRACGGGRTFSAMKALFCTMVPPYDDLRSRNIISPLVGKEMDAVVMVGVLVVPQFEG